MKKNQHRVERQERELWFVRDKSTRGFKSVGEALKFRLWKYVGRLIFKWTPEPLNFLRRWQLMLYGAKIGKHTYISRKAVFVLPWLLKVGNHSSFDDFAYVNGRLTVGDYVSVASFAKVVTAGHDVYSRAFSWTTTHVNIQDGAFIGANAFIMGDTSIGTLAVVGANSFVNKDVADNTIIAGNPAKVIGKRLPEEDFGKYAYR